MGPRSVMAGKSARVKQVVEGPVSEQVPALLKFTLHW
jgi:hypothetical protein